MLEVEDDGCGCDLEQVRQGGGIGLLAMHERAEKLGATLEVHSTPGGGMRVRVRLLDTNNRALVGKGDAL
jgi:signal transduction histidine kinase